MIKKKNLKSIRTKRAGLYFFGPREPDGFPGLIYLKHFPCGPEMKGASWWVQSPKILKKWMRFNFKR